VHENASVRYATLANLASWLGSGNIKCHAMPCHTIVHCVKKTISSLDKLLKFNEQFNSILLLFIAEY
jgi:hypothetical protein